MPDRPDENCMTIIIGKNASATGHVILGHNEDDAGRYTVRHGYVPPRDHDAAAFLPCEPGRAAIPQAAHSFGFYWSEVVGAQGGVSGSDVMINENGVCVVSDSAGPSREDAPDDEVLVDGGVAYNVRRVVAERAESARHGVELIRWLVETWGYAPGGRLYMVADKDEAFVAQLVRGRRCLIARVPDDAVAAIPNHYVVRSRRDAEEVICSPDLATYAVKRGWIASEEAFDFYEAYQNRERMNAPSNTLRQDYAYRLLTGITFDRNNLPFSVKGIHPYTTGDVMDVMACHYEGTEDDPRFGPGQSPHCTEITRICRDSTIESTVVEFADEPKDITAWTAFGRPCQQLSIPLHPLSGVTEAIGRMDDPAAALENHLSPANNDVTYQKNSWQALRDLGNIAEFFHSKCEEDMRAFRRAWHDAQDKTNREKRLPAPQRDAEAAADALAAMKQFAEAHFRRVDTAVRREDDQYIVSFSASDAPREDSLLFGLGCLNLRTEYARALPGSLRRIADGRWEAAFNAKDVFCVEVGAGVYECFLGGVMENGLSFAGMALVKYELD